MDSSRENWWQAESPRLYKDLGIGSVPPLPKELNLGRKFLGHLIAARTSHGDFAN